MNAEINKIPGFKHIALLNFLCILFQIVDKYNKNRKFILKL